MGVKRSERSTHQSRNRHTRTQLQDQDIKTAITAPPAGLVGKAPRSVSAAATSSCCDNTHPGCVCVCVWSLSHRLLFSITWPSLLHWHPIDLFSWQPLHIFPWHLPVVRGTRGDVTQKWEQRDLTQDSKWNAAAEIRSDQIRTLDSTLQETCWSLLSSTASASSQKILQTIFRGRKKSVKYPFRADTEFKNKILHLVELDLGEKKSCCTHPST